MRQLKITKSDNQFILLSVKEEDKVGGVFGLFSKPKHTFSVVLEQDIDNFNIDTIAFELTRLMKENHLFNKNSKLGMGIALRKKNNSIRVTLVSILV
jgi:hypothetical protein